MRTVKRALFAAAALLGLAALAAPSLKAGDALIRPLVEAKATMGKDPVAAVQRIEEAQKALGELLDELEAPPTLRKAFEQAYAEAAIAVGRRSAANADSRIWAVRGMVGKVYYEALFNALAKGDVKQAAAYLDALARATAMDRATYRKALALVRARDVEGLRRILERSFADRIARALYLAERAKETPAAYAAAAKAYGLFFVVQDSPTFANVGSEEFLTALTDLTDQRRERFLEAVRSLRERFRAAVKRIDLGEPLPTQVYVPRQAAPAPAPAARPKRKVETPTFATPRWLDPAQRKVVLALATAMGYDYVTDFNNRITQAKTQLGAATASLAAGDFEAARSHLQDAAWTYSFYLAPLFSVADDAFNAALSHQIIRLSQITGLRTSDLTVLTNALNAMETRFFRGTPPPRGLSFQLSLLNFTGPPRTAMFLVAGLLALLPLYLSRRVFAQRAAYWRALGVALALLLLPAITEALSYLGEYLAARGMDFGRGLVSLSIFQSLSAQMAWGVLVIVVVLAATWGFLGVAAQFGAAPFRLSLRRRRAAAATTSAPAQEVAVDEIDWGE